jgi:hypothetical protein
MNKPATLGIAIAFLVIIGLVAHIAKPPASTAVSNADDSAIRAFVTAFGSHFKNVSLLAPDVANQIASEYGLYASQDLLLQWQNNPADAPGRQTSSPWPDRVDVVEVSPLATGDYQIEANVIEVANSETATAEPAAVYPISLTVAKQGSGWITTTFEKGAYSTLPQRQTIVGIWECLPHKDTSGPQTDECAFGIKTDAGDYYAVDTHLMATYPVDHPTGTRVTIEGVVTPVEMLNSIQKYDIKGILSATTIESL